MVDHARQNCTWTIAEGSCFKAALELKTQLKVLLLFCVLFLVIDCNLTSDRDIAEVERDGFDYYYYYYYYYNNDNNN